MPPLLTSVIFHPVLMFSTSPPCALNVVRFPAAANCDAAIKGRSWPSSLRNCSFWPRFGIQMPFAAQYLPPALDMALAWISPANAFGGATDSAAPECISASTKRDPAVRVSLATAHRFGNWTHGTRMYQHNSGASLKLTFFLLPRLEDLIAVFLWIPLTCVAVFAVPKLPAQRILDSRVKGSSNQASTHRQLFLRSATGTPLFLVVRSALRLIQIIGPRKEHALTLLFTLPFPLLPWLFAATSTSICQRCSAVGAVPVKPISAFASAFRTRSLCSKNILSRCLSLCLCPSPEPSSL